MAPSEKSLVPFQTSAMMDFFRTCKYHSTSDGCSRSSNSSKVNIHGIDNVFKIKRDLYIEELHDSLSMYIRKNMEWITTFAPINNATADPTLTRVPRLSCKTYHKNLGAGLLMYSLTFGHRYWVISFIIAQSAFLCSLFDMVCSASKGS